MPITTPQQKVDKSATLVGIMWQLSWSGYSGKSAGGLKNLRLQADLQLAVWPIPQAGPRNSSLWLKLEESIAFDAVLVPVGGGEPHFRVSAYIKETDPQLIIGVEAEEARSMKYFEQSGPVKLPNW